MLITLCDKSGDSIWSLEADAVPRIGEFFRIEANYIIQQDWAEDTFAYLKAISGKRFLVKEILHRATISGTGRQTTAIFVQVEEI